MPNILESLSPALLALSPFLLGACPFSLWVGHIFLRGDIREFGDGNPGAVNVFRVGGRLSFCLAVILDVAKRAPFVILAHSTFALHESAVTVVALIAVLGNAFSPTLRFKGGKPIAVTGGAVLALPDRAIPISLVAFMFLSLLFLERVQ